MNKKSLVSAFFSLFLSFVLLAFCLAVPVHAELVWDIHVVDEDVSGIGNGYCPIVVDADNNSHIAYSGAPKMMYASWNVSGWDIQLIEYASAHDLALDADGNPHISYLKRRTVAPYDRRNLMYATANVTKPPEDTPTSPDSPLLIASTAIIIGTVIAVTAYVWKKKRKH